MGDGVVQVAAESGATVKSDRIYSLQALRGIAAAMVVLAHAIEHAPKVASNSVMLTGRFGVEIFFVISGFVISYVAGSGVFRPGSFLFRRVWRVVPLYWALTLLVAALAFAAPSIFKTTSFDLGYFIKSLLFIPDPLPGTTDYRPLFKLGWTLNYEMFFYLLIAALFWCRSMTIRAIGLSLVLGALVLAGFLLRPEPSMLAFYLSPKLFPFIGGVWAAVLWRRNLIQDNAKPLAIVAALLFVGFTGWAYQLPRSSNPYTYDHIIMSIAAFMSVLLVLSCEGFFKRLRGSTWLGDISYSLYLVHMFVVGAGWAVLNKLGVKVDTPLGAVGVIGMCLGSILAADLTYRLFERPIMKLMPRRA